MVTQCHCIPGGKRKLLVPPCGHCGRCSRCDDAHLDNFSNDHWREVYFREKKDTLDGMVQDLQNAQEYALQAAQLGHDAGTLDCAEAYQLSMDAVLGLNVSTGYVTDTLISGASPEDPSDPLLVSVSFKIVHASASSSADGDAPGEDEEYEDFYTDGIAKPC